MLGFTNPDIHGVIKENLGVTTDVDFLPYPDLEKASVEDIEFIKSSPLIKPGTVITAFIYDVDTGKVKVVASDEKKWFLYLLIDDILICGRANNIIQHPIPSPNRYNVYKTQYQRQLLKAKEEEEKINEALYKIRFDAAIKRLIDEGRIDRPTTATRKSII